MAQILQQKKFLHLRMLFQLENTDKEDVNKLLAFANQNHLKLSLVDDNVEYHLPGKPLTEQQISQLIESSRQSGTISMEDAHQTIRSNYNAD